MKKITSLMAFVAVFGLAVAAISPALVSAGTYTGTNGKLAYTSPTGIRITNADGTGVVTIPNTDTNSSQPRISPDGKKVVWSQYAGTANTDPVNIKVANIDGTGSATSLTTGVANRNNGATWSPDSKWIAYAQDTTLDATQGGAIRVVNMDASVDVELINQVTCTGSSTQSDGWEEPSWSPDGTRIVVINRCNAVNGGIYSFHISTYTAGSSTTPNINNTDLASSTHVAINDAQKIYYWPSYAPDMSKLIYVQTDSSGGINLPYQIVSSTDTDTATVNLLQGSLDYIATAVYAPDNTTYAWQTTVNQSGTLYPQVIINSGKVVGSEGATSIDWGPAANPVTTVSDDQSSTNFTVASGETLTVASTGKVGDVTIQSGGTLKGTGTVGTLNVLASGHVAPGNSPGCINAGNTTFTSGSTFDVEIAGKTVCTEYDQLKVTGTIDLGNATLNTAFLNGFVPAVNDSFTIVESTGALTGTFNGLAEGATFTVNGVVFKISYVGNKVTLTVVGGNVAGAATTPNTGIKLLMANPVLTMMLTTLTAGALVVMARKYGLVSQFEKIKK